jgi:phosphate acetyltransferase
VVLVARSIYITSAEGHSGKSTVALGVLDSLSRVTPRVGVFRAIARSTAERDYVLEMLLDHDGVDLPYEDCIGATYDDVRADPEAALVKIVEHYTRVASQCDAVVVLGSDYTDVGSPAELAFNARIAANLATPVLLVLGGRQLQGHTERLGSTEARTAQQIGQLAALAVGELRRGNAELAATVVNRADGDRTDEIVEAVSSHTPGTPVWALPEDRLLVAPTTSCERSTASWSRATRRSSPARRSASRSRACRWRTSCPASTRATSCSSRPTAATRFWRR